MACRTSLQGPHPTSLTTRSINQGVSLLNNLEMQRQAKRTRYSTHLADEPDTDTDSIVPIYDAFLETQGPEGILTIPALFPRNSTSFGLTFDRTFSSTGMSARGQTNVPSGSYAEKKLFYSGRHHLYGHKVEASVFPNGFAINCTSYYKGSVSDKTIFDENLDFHAANLCKEATDMDLADADGLGPDRELRWAVLVDKGYQGAQRNVRAVLQLKKPMGGILTFEELRRNDRIASDRVIVENFFGRLKTLWGVCSDTYRWNRKTYDVVFQTCMAFTNAHVRFHPLRAEDDDANSQYINRLNAIGTKMVKNKNTATRTYRSKRKARLSMFMAAESSLAAADAGGSDTDMGSNSEIENPRELVDFMASVRHGEHFLTTAHLVMWLKTYQPEWLAEYMSSKPTDERAYKSLVQWCLRFANRHGYHHRVPCPAKSTQGELAVTQEAFAADFRSTFGHIPKHAWINVDETPVYYDMPPGRTLARVGQSSHVKESQKHSDRITAVLSIRADGTKMPLLLIVKGRPDGDIATKEVPMYPAGLVYAVQKTAYMNQRVRNMYLREVLKPELDCPSVPLADNLKCHVSKKSYKIMQDELYSDAFLQPLPANTTSVLQPLDVGVMGPFKQMCRTE
ncbi:hypothetical protein B5M09_010794 [Aphanomyces astaci]|uniref:DDE Tnp4 domain-containing protein n=1 Tax=Aphanomyces astaci TaxID=112090 RepID=A0A425CQR0_APHAT|nr:hypothetical protein B5M09_010794 [Aphanomyces astaci]